MKLSFRAFKEWVEFPGSAQELADVLAGLGFPNDGIVHRGEGLDQVVVGKVLTKKKHPQADRLNLLTVDIGSEVLPIVCGAHNMTEGDYVALAPMGAKIPGKDGEGLVMREAKIRGETSKGMCCSEQELRLSDESEGIILLPKERVELDGKPQLGKKVADLVPLEDWILEVDITPNRGDALSIRGLAREVAAKTGLKLRYPASVKWKTPSPEVHPTIESFEDASGFAGCLIQGVKQAPTPDKWVRFLMGFGQRSISSLVDISNIVLFELGHPIHFFDADKVDPMTIGVRRARAGEKLELLNGKTINLHGEDLVIADASGPLSLAGVMGGARSAVSESTKNVLMEVASFRPALIRATARRHDLSSESSIRFERGVTAYRFDEVVERALGLLKEIAGFEAAQGTKVVDRQLTSVAVSVLWDRARIESKLGPLAKSDDELFELLRRLEYGFEPKGSTTRVLFPWYRTDVAHLEDLMEDIARLLGYDQLARKPLTSVESVSALRDLHGKVRLSDQLIDAFCDQGFAEAVHMSFTSPQIDGRLTKEVVAVELENPIHSEKSILRTRVMPQLLERARINAFHGEGDIRLVEVGPVFRCEGASVYEESPRGEDWAIACVWYPRAQDEKRLWARRVDPYFEFKGIVEAIWARFQMDFDATANGLSACFHPKRQWVMKHGMAGELHPAVLKDFDLSGRVFAGEWRLSGQVRPARYAIPAQYPGMDMDASFLVPKSLEVASMLAAFKKVKVSYLESIRPYDIFEAKDLGEGRKSVTFAMRYRSPEKTLTSEEAKESHQALVNGLISSFKDQEITLR